MIGASWGVEWCVVGLDRNWAYNPALQNGASLNAAQILSTVHFLFCSCNVLLNTVYV